MPTKTKIKMNEEESTTGVVDPLVGRGVVVTKKNDKDWGRELKVEAKLNNHCLRLEGRTQLNSKDLPDESLRARQGCAVIYDKGEDDDEWLKSLVKSRSFGRGDKIRIVEKSGNDYRELEGTGRD